MVKHNFVPLPNRSQIVEEPKIAAMIEREIDVNALKVEQVIK